jgi:NADH-quinone oxidoreductase subunit M
MNFPILSTLIFLPIVLSIFVMFAKSGKQAKVSAIVIAGANFVLSLVALVFFNAGSADTQFSEKYSWIPGYHINYFVSIDGISLVLILLTTFLSLLAIVFSSSKELKPKVYYTAFLALEGLAIGLFCAFDAVLFYVFFEAMLIPMFLIIGVWGGENRMYAAFKFFLYTLFGSLLFLVALVYIYLQLGSFDISVWQQNAGMLSALEQKWLFIAMLIAFAIKVPMVGVHTWLPDAHVQAPTAGSVILAGVLLKVGTYAMLRFLLPVLPEASAYFATFVMALSAVAIVYASFVAFAQKDIKKMIAYSSIAHMGFITLGIFAATELAIQGAVMQMINHGLVSAGLFFAIGVIYNRLHTRDIDKLGNLAEKMPIYAFVFMVLMLASVGLPGTSNFIGEITILIGSFSTSPIITLISVSGILLGACYMLKLYKEMFYKQGVQIAKVCDLKAKEVFVFVPLLILILVFGFMPNLIFDLTAVAVKNIIS